MGTSKKSDTRQAADILLVILWLVITVFGLIIYFSPFHSHNTSYTSNTITEPAKKFAESPLLSIWLNPIQEAALDNGQTNVLLACDKRTVDPDYTEMRTISALDFNIRRTPDGQRYIITRK